MNSLEAVVVGHGLTPKDKGWGGKIDSADTVIRMWNWHWQNKSDYGERYDVGFYEISPTEMKRFWKHNVKFPSNLWLASMLKEYDGLLPSGTTIVVHPERWESDAINLGGIGYKGKRLRLTRGVRAAAWIIEQLPRGSCVVLVGFDNLKVGIGLSPEEGFPLEYRECPAMFPFRTYVGGTRRYGSHDYGVEEPFLRQLAERRGVTIEHAQDIWL